MMEQYFRVKALHPDALLFFRLGDFYEMFYEDARTGAHVLEIALTSRQNVPMCGVPFHAVNSYLAKLLRQGFKVAVCEQVEDPRTAKGVVRREVVKVLTPGTAVEIDPEQGKDSVFVAALHVGPTGWGLALADLAVGEIRVLEGSESDLKPLVDELYKAAPREIVVAEGEEDAAALTAVLDRSDLRRVLKSPVEAWAFEIGHARHTLTSHFGTPTLHGFDLEDKPRAATAAGALLYYLKKVRKDSVSLIGRLSLVRPSDRLILDAATIRNLELVRNARDGRSEDSLLDVIDLTVTAMGGRLIRDWLLRPLTERAGIEARLDAVEAFLGAPIARGEMREALKGILDLERLTGRISLGAAHPRDCVALRKSLLPLPGVRAAIEPVGGALLDGIRSSWDDAGDIAGLIGRAILDEPAFLLTEGGIIRDGYDAELDELRAVSRSGKSFIVELEKRERERTGIGSLKVRYNRVAGYYIEVTKPNLPQVPADYIRKQTLVSSERFLTPELKTYEEKVLHAEERIAEIEARLFQALRETVAAETRRLQAVAAAVARLDVLAGLAELAARRGYARPVIDEGDALTIAGGRHPVVEAVSPEPFIPNDARLDCEADQILIITGPNMGGKSTFLRQTALIALLAQMGSFVPAASASIGLLDRIFTRIGATDFLSAGQSTFMVEMLETAAILHNATPRSLILLDEIGRGTSTFDGLSIAWAVAEYLHENERVRAKTLFATHYHELTELALTLPRIKNHHVAVEERGGEVVFLRRIVPGPSDRSYGIHVAQLAGLPREVISRAREILFNLEKAELDDAGTPRLAYAKERKPDRRQMWLFGQDRQSSALEEIRESLENCEVGALTPLEALNLLNRLVERLRQ
ncbi:MAG: DNA mismatch repair protein MutS [Candidatus Aminicenantes bacterium]|nr:DNA mismatch repair protein MutS [Candidatus Aminicenantes bacterium]